MGYHSVPGRMALVYSRDGAARSLRLLESMLDEIRKGFFFPDCTRSGRLHGPAKEFLNGWPSEGAAADSAHPLGEPALAPQGDAKSEVGTDLCLEPIPVLTSDAEEEAESSRRAEDSGHMSPQTLQTLILQRLKCLRCVGLQYLRHRRAFAFCSTGKLACSILSRMVMNEFWSAGGWSGPRTLTLRVCASIPLCVPSVAKLLAKPPEREARCGFGAVGSWRL